MLESCLKKQPIDFDYLFFLGKLLREREFKSSSDDRQRALHLLERALQQQPKHAGCLEELTDLLLKIGDINRAGNACKLEG
jgi:hypothetical protein